MSWKVWCEMRFAKISWDKYKSRTLRLGQLRVLHRHEEYKIYYKTHHKKMVRFMKVEMADVGAKIARITQSNLLLISSRRKIPEHSCSLHPCRLVLHSHVRYHKLF